MTEVDRGDFLRLGAGGLLGVAAAGLIPAAAHAQLPTPAPEDDDVAYVEFAAVAERASRDFYSAALKTSFFSKPERDHLSAVHRAKRAHIILLDAAAATDAPQTGDFTTVLPARSLATRRRVLSLGRRLEELLVRVYISGSAFTENDATRLLLARLLAYDTQSLGWLRLRSGVPAPIGLPLPINLDEAADTLDGYLSTPSFPGD